MQEDVLDWGGQRHVQAAPRVFSASLEPVRPPCSKTTEDTQEDELGGAGEEMRFALPAAPSPAALLFLLAAGREVARAGGAPGPPARARAARVGAGRRRARRHHVRLG